MAVPNVPNWQAKILAGLGAPATPENIKFLNAWAQAEGGSAANNPFNTTEPGHGTIGNYNSVGVKQYGTPQGGIQATIDTLQNGRYGAILNALHQGTSALADAQAEATTPWGTGSLIMKVLGGRVTEGQPTGAIPSPATSSSGPVADGLASEPRPVSQAQHVVTSKLPVLGKSLAVELMSQAATLQNGGAPDLKNMFTLAKGFLSARRAAGNVRPAPLGGTVLAQGVGMTAAPYRAQIANLNASA